MLRRGNNGGSRNIERADITMVYETEFENNRSSLHTEGLTITTVIVNGVMEIYK